MDEDPDGSAPDLPLPDVGSEETAPPAQDSPEEDSAPISMEEAAERALKELEGESPEAGTTAPEAKASSEPPRDEPKPPAEEPKDRQYNLHAAAAHIRSLIRQGRIDELPPTARGEIEALIREQSQTYVTQAQLDAQREAQESAADKEAFLELDQLAIDDPAEFAQLITSDPNAYQFYTLYKQANPGVSALNPDGPETFSREYIESATQSTAREVNMRWLNSVETLLEGFGAEAGVDYNALRAQHQQSGLGTLFKAVIDSAVEKQVAKRVAKEKEALELEFQAQRTALQVPRGVRATPGSRAEAGGSSSKLTFEDAFALAEKQLSAPR